MEQVAEVHGLLLGVMVGLIRVEQNQDKVLQLGDLTISS